MAVGRFLEYCCNVLGLNEAKRDQRRKPTSYDINDDQHCTPRGKETLTWNYWGFCLPCYRRRLTYGYSLPRRAPFRFPRLSELHFTLTLRYLPERAPCRHSGLPKLPPEPSCLSKFFFRFALLRLFSFFRLIATNCNVQISFSNCPLQILSCVNSFRSFPLKKLGDLSFNYGSWILEVERRQELRQFWRLWRQICRCRLRGLKCEKDSIHAAHAAGARSALYNLL